jgi:hypothetical protein
VKEYNSDESVKLKRSRSGNRRGVGIFEAGPAPRATATAALEDFSFSRGIVQMVVRNSQSKTRYSSAFIA